MAVGFGKDQRLWHLPASGEYLRQLVAEGPDDGAFWVGVYHATVKLVSRILPPLILPLPTLFARQALAFFNLLFRLDKTAAPRHVGFNNIDLIADVYAVRHCLFVAVLA